MSKISQFKAMFFLGKESDNGRLITENHSFTINTRFRESKNFPLFRHENFFIIRDSDYNMPYFNFKIKTPGSFAHKGTLCHCIS